MHTQLDKELKQAQRDIARKKKLEYSLKWQRSQRTAFACKVQERCEALQKENNDVDKLEGFSFKKAAYALLCMLVEKKEEEKAEVLQAQIRYDAAKKDLAAIDETIHSTEQELKQYKDSQKHFEQLYEQKRQALMQISPDMAQMVMMHTQCTNEMSNLVREADEAMDVGREVLEALGTATHNMDKARNWEVFTTSKRGICRSVMESYLKDVETEIWHVSRLLRQFNKELTDIGLDADIQIQTVYFETEALFRGWMWRSEQQYEMDKAELGTNSVRSEVSGVMAQLRNLRAEADRKAKDAKRALDRLILNSVSTAPLQEERA